MRTQPYVRTLPLLGTLALAAGGAALVYTQGISHHWPLRFDEASHALLALQMADSVWLGDGFALALDSYSQVLWPPLHSWVTGLVFLVWGASGDSARAVSLAGYVLLALAMYALGSEVGAEVIGYGAGGEEARAARGRWCGLVAAALALAAPLSRALAARVYQEMLGAPILIAGLWLYLRAARGTGLHTWVAVGVLIVVTYLARMPYGLLLLACVVLDRLGSAWPHPRRLLSRENGAWLAPVAVFMLLWFSYAPKAERALYWLSAGLGDHAGPPDALYYPASFLPAAGSPILALYLVLGLLLSLPGLRQRVLRAPALLAVLQFVPAALSPNHQMRLNLPCLLALDVLAAFWIVVGVERLRARSARWAWVAVVGIALILVEGFSTSIDSTRPVVNYTGLEPYTAPVEPLLDYVDEQMAGRPPAMLVGALGTASGLDPALLDWHAVAETRHVSVYGSGVLYPVWDQPAEAQLATNWRTQGVPEVVAVELARLGGRGQWPNPPGSGRALWLSAGVTPVRTPADLRAALAGSLARYAPGRVVAIGDLSPGAYYTPAFLRTAMVLGGYRLVAERRFEAEQVVVMTFE